MTQEESESALKEIPNVVDRLVELIQSAAVYEPHRPKLFEHRRRLTMAFQAAQRKPRANVVKELKLPASRGTTPFRIRLLFELNGNPALTCKEVAAVMKIRPQAVAQNFRRKEWFVTAGTGRWKLNGECYAEGRSLRPSEAGTVPSPSDNHS